MDSTIPYFTDRLCCKGPSNPFPLRIYKRSRHRLTRFSSCDDPSQIIRWSCVRYTNDLALHSFALANAHSSSFHSRSFFQGLCVLGYCIAPLDIAAFIACFVRIIYIRAPVALAAWAWCIWGKYTSILVVFLSPDLILMG